MKGLRQPPLCFASRRRFPLPNSNSSSTPIPWSSPSHQLQFPFIPHLNLRAHCSNTAPRLKLANSCSASLSISTNKDRGEFFINEDNDDSVGNCSRFFVAAAIACAYFVFVTRCQRVLAAEQTMVGGAGGVQGLGQSIVKGYGPKLMQVFHVFKDQGLILASLLGLSAFFSMAETSITTLWPWKVIAFFNIC